MDKLLKPDILNSLNLKIEWANHIVLDSRWKITRLTVPFTKLYYVRSGEGWIRYGDCTVPMEGGHVYLLPAHLEVSSGCTCLEKIYFHISMLGFEKADLLSSIHRVCSLPFSEEDYVRLLGLLQSSDYLDVLKIKHILFQTVVSFVEQQEEASLPVREYSDTVKKTMLYIQKNLSVSLTSAQIAKALYFSETKMRTCFKKETGKTIGEYKNDLIFSQICILLVTGDLPVAEISRKFGFCDPYHLSRRFKERYRQTPTEYRRANNAHK